MTKLFDILKTVFVWVVTIAAVAMMIFTIFSVATFDRNDRSVFGYRFYIVQTDSMAATDFAAGDIVFVKEVDPSTLQVGDIIAFTSENAANYGETVTHKIRTITTTESGEPGFVTYGTTTDTDDESIVSYSHVLGRYTGRLPLVGKFFAFLKTTLGYILCILVPFMLLIAYNGIQCVILFREYKREQLRELREERRKLQAERRRTEEMMQELLDMRSQLERSGVQLPPRDEPFDF